MELFKLFHSTNNIPVNCLVKCKDKQKIEESVGEGIKALATVMLGSKTILNKLGYKQYRLHLSNHLSSQKAVDWPSLTTLLMGNSFSWPLKLRNKMSTYCNLTCPMKQEKVNNILLIF